jgi:hypothetical protein
MFERIESELNATVVASNPAMFCMCCPKLSYPMSGYGKLMREWPATPA